MTLVRNFSDIRGTREYVEFELKGFPFKIPMQGQVKLLLNEIRFLSEEVRVRDFPPHTFHVLYIGSGKGYHIPHLIELYGDLDIQWTFFDPVGHCRKLREMERAGKCKIFNSVFTHKDISRFVKESRRLLFVSDIRTAESNNSEPTVGNIVKDGEIQNKVVRSLAPFASLLKFRHPYPDEWNGEIIEKPVGKEFIQAFCKVSSNELRIFIRGIPVFKVLDMNELERYERGFMFFNNNNRKRNDILLACDILNKHDHLVERMTPETAVSCIEKLVFSFRH